MDIKNTCTLIDKIAYFILMRNDRVKYLYYLSKVLKLKDSTIKIIQD